MDQTFKRTFDALGIRNFRLFMIGQGISLCGTWTQTVGLSWLVLQLTHSGTQLGLIVAAQYTPILVLGLFGGVIADRFDKRRTLYVTQSVMGVLALALGILVGMHLITLWMVYLFAVGLGLASVVDFPARQSFVIEMTGSDHLKNAISLNSIMVNAARVIGPSIAGLLIATTSISTCFIINALSYIAVLIALRKMRDSELHHAPRTKSLRTPGQVRASLRYVWNTPTLRAVLIMMFIIGTFAYEFPVILPLFATITLHGLSGTYSALMAATGIGAIIGGTYIAGRGTAGMAQLILSSVYFGLFIILAAEMPSFWAAFVVLVGVGVLSVIFVSLGNTILQLTSDPQMRGRVMALWSIAFLGTTPIGGPIVGYISDHTNPRIGLAIGGVASIVAASVGYCLYRRKSAMPSAEVNA